MHDWTIVEAGIFHAFHHCWIFAISDVLNARLLPKDYYALPEQIGAGVIPDVLTLQDDRPASEHESGAGGVALAPMLKTRPQTRFTAETDAEVYRRKKKAIVIRHVSGDRIVAVVEIVSPGNKVGKAFDAFVDKAYELLEKRIHLLIIDPFPPGARDPNGIHAAIWEALAGKSFELPSDKRLTLVSYECDLTTRAYAEVVAVGDSLPDMPVYLMPDRYVMVPLEATYQTAFAAMPRRWRTVLQPDEKGKP
jgi:hypothetical protein